MLKRQAGRSVEIQAQLLAFEFGQGKTDLDFSEDPPPALSVSLPFGARCGNDCQCVCYDFLSSGHMPTSLFVLVMFSF
jgi:hypothetical protein